MSAGLRSFLIITKMTTQSAYTFDVYLSIFIYQFITLTPSIHPSVYIHMFRGSVHKYQSEFDLVLCLDLFF